MKFYAMYWVDSTLTFIIAVYLVYMGYDLLKKSTKMLMLFTPEHIKVEDIVVIIHKIPEVKKLHHVHIWCLNDDELHLEAHLDFKEDISISRFTSILNEIEIVLHDKFHINHINIQPEFNKEDPKDIIVQD